MAAAADSTMDVGVWVGFGSEVVDDSVGESRAVVGVGTAGVQYGCEAGVHGECDTAFGLG